MEAGILDVAAIIPDCLPSDKQSLKAIETLRKMIADDYQHGGDIVWQQGYPPGKLLYPLAQTRHIVPTNYSCKFLTLVQHFNA